jgi:hypothetical protein
LQDIVHRPAASETVVVSIWLESQRSEELAGIGDDSDVGICDEKMDLPILVRGTDADVPEPAQVAQGERAEAIDFVAADAVVDRRGSIEGLGLDESIEDGHWGLPVEGAVWSDVVVVGAEGIELVLQLGQRAGRPLLLEEALEGLVKAFHLAAGLRVVGSGVFWDDAEAFELQLQDDFAPSLPPGEDSPIVGEEGSGQSERIRSCLEDVGDVVTLDGAKAGGGE